MLGLPQHQLPVLSMLELPPLLPVLEITYVQKVRVTIYPQYAGINQGKRNGDSEFEIREELASDCHEMASGCSERVTQKKNRDLTYLKCLTKKVPNKLTLEKQRELIYLRCLSKAIYKKESEKLHSKTKSRAPLGDRQGSHEEGISLETEDGYYDVKELESCEIESIEEFALASKDEDESSTGHPQQDLDLGLDQDDPFWDWSPPRSPE